MSAPACERFDLLRRRLSCFVGDARDGRSSVGGLIGQLEAFGEVAIVGGMLRDMLLKDSYAAFSSDVDLVIDAPDSPALRRVLEAHDAVENRFGGYALGTEWKADVWLLGRTWARVQGHAEVERVDDLLGTTFFNWDAVLYSWTRKRIICRDDYLDDLDARRLDINLEPNPNRLGSCVRALRSAVLWGAALSSRLADFASGVVEEAGPASLLAAEARAYGHRRVLTPAILEEAYGEFRAAAAAGATARPLRAAKPGNRDQLALPLPWTWDTSAAVLERSRPQISPVRSRRTAQHPSLGLA